MHVGARARHIAAPLILLVINLAVAWPLFRTEYLDQLGSIEGAFLSLATYIRHHWPLYDWFPLWYGGYPFTRAYQPLFHYVVAFGSLLSGASPARSYHFVAGVAYAMGGVAFYFLAKVVTADRRAAFAGALLYSLFSPSLWFPVIRHDAGGQFHARRLQAMVVYGEGPNVTGLTLCIVALALVIAACSRRRGPLWLIAAVSLALVPATNWPATVALALGLICYAFSMSRRQVRQRLPRLGAICGVAILMALPFALPSTIASTFLNAKSMGEGTTVGWQRWVALAVILAGCALFRRLSKRSGQAFRFSLLFTTMLVTMVGAAVIFDVRVLPQVMRFHLAMEIAITLLAAALLKDSRGPMRPWMFAAIGLFCMFQFTEYFRYARTIVRPLDVQKSIEYEEARWFDANMQGARVAAPGSVSFWMNAFTETPQYTGCCDQSLLSQQNAIAAYIVGAGFEDPAKSADFSLLWLKAFAVNAVAIGGPNSREWYKAYQFPSRFRNVLPLAWEDGDDAIYRIPERSPSLARVVPATKLVTAPPENGIDDKQLRPFVGALEDAALPLAGWRWLDLNRAVIQTNMHPDQALSVAVNFHRGWSASVAGKSVPVSADGLNLMVVRPGCDGDCRVELKWTPGVERILTWVLALAGLLCGAMFLRPERRSAVKMSRVPVYR